MLLESLLQGDILALKKLVFGSVAVGCALFEALVVRNVMGSTLITVHEWNITRFQFAL